jgi:hypothetical protein
VATVEQLLATLRRLGVARGRELASLLDISQPTLSRLVAAAADRVGKIGRARATRYALTRSIPTLGTQVPVYRIGTKGNVQRYGVMHLLAEGRHWIERDGAGTLFAGLPPFASDMSPQGYMGRSFPIRYPELGLPARITDWNDDHRLIALARRGEDCVGDLVIGSESLDRFLADTPRPVRREDYPELADAALSGQAGSSAGGEQPKFTAYSENRHVLVKFVHGDSSPAADRWRDLLVCERAALEAVGAAGLESATASWFDVEGDRFLEVERFDRMGARGRTSVLSLAAIDDEYFGYRDSWTKAAQRLATTRRLDSEDARKMRWLDAFGQLIGNSDRHFGNLSFFVQDSGFLRLAPVYDMLPMVFAPVGASVIERPWEPASPSADNLDVWPDAARHAGAYWSSLAKRVELSSGFRQRCAQCRDALESHLSK